MRSPSVFCTLLLGGTMLHFTCARTGQAELAGTEIPATYVIPDAYYELPQLAGKGRDVGETSKSIGVAQSVGANLDVNEPRRINCDDVKDAVKTLLQRRIKVSQFNLRGPSDGVLQIASYTVYQVLRHQIIFSQYESCKDWYPDFQKVSEKRRQKIYSFFLTSDFRLNSLSAQYNQRVATDLKIPNDVAFPRFFIDEVRGQPDFVRRDMLAFCGNTSEGPSSTGKYWDYFKMALKYHVEMGKNVNLAYQDKDKRKQQASNMITGMEKAIQSLTSQLASKLMAELNLIVEEVCGKGRESGCAAAEP
ncbi:hypothetical protein IWQ60_003575 [Tieghemiomyces parasiticus]|uniref:Uncharacterized protein n=1 Tax=Tieghemiomyces parasiticus TaxID=78921 RepID=A0A9W8ACZ9_9FUNG|nr:hypothetical protein IWQ60_003575 [Tieghemiomyces parasiticus]